MNAVILSNGALFEVICDGQVVFTDADKIECGFWASEHGYTIN